MSEAIFRFLHPWFLALLPLPLIWCWLQIRSDRRHTPALLYSSLDAMRGLPVSLRQRVQGVLPYSRCAVLCLGILALARPQHGIVEFTSTTFGLDIALVLDVSGSMQDVDFRPNRLEAAKASAVRFIGERKSDRITVVIFGESAALLCPPTLDTTAAQMFVEAIHDGMIGNQATAVGDGLALGVDKLKDSPAASRVAILLTDGDNNSGKLTPMQAAEIAKALGVRVYTIGVGREVMGLSGGLRGQMRLARGAGFDEEILREVAEFTGGRYFRATDEKALTSIYEEIDRMEKTEIEVDRTADFNERYGVFWFPALLLLGLEFLLRAFWLRRLP